MCAKLGIELIGANLPQAKGRVERGHGTHQDRLIKKMRLKKIATNERANEFLFRLSGFRKRPLNYSDWRAAFTFFDVR
jgi:hypothetical protein